MSEYSNLFSQFFFSFFYTKFKKNRIFTFYVPIQYVDKCTNERTKLKLLARQEAITNEQHTCKTKRMKWNEKKYKINLPFYIPGGMMLFAILHLFRWMKKKKKIWEKENSINSVTTTKAKQKFAFDELSKQVTFANRISDNKLRSISNDSSVFFYYAVHSLIFWQKTEITKGFFIL